MSWWISGLRTSFIQLHSKEKRALPMNFAKYGLAIQLFKIYNGYSLNEDWQDMNVQQNFNASNVMFQINDFLNTKVGKNILCNRLPVLNKLVNLDWLNLSLTALKLKAKSIFLVNWLRLWQNWNDKQFFFNVNLHQFLMKKKLF